jgi:pimeloyl-ACP methyl ester carboxylesterase
MTAEHFGVIRQVQSSANEKEQSDSVAAGDAMKGKEQSDLSEVLFCNIGASQMAYRKVGNGEPLILIHGYPLSGMTFRKVVPALSALFTCYVIDLPGAGETRWTKQTDFGTKGQAESVKAFAEKLDLRSYSVLAHDTGATVARQLAIIDPERVKKMVLIGTEIPHHRPPWIQFYQAFSYVPGSDMLFRRSLQKNKFLRSSRGFGGCFFDLNLLNGDFHDLFITPLINSYHLRLGQRYRLRGIDWKLVDSLAQGHSKIQCPVILIWGQDDPVFPVERAREMVSQFKECRGLKVIPKAKLFVQEEQPALVARDSIEFLKD